MLGALLLLNASKMFDSPIQLLDISKHFPVYKKKMVLCTASSQRSQLCRSHVPDQSAHRNMRTGLQPNVLLENWLLGVREPSGTSFQGYRAIESV